MGDHVIYSTDCGVDIVTTPKERAFASALGLALDKLVIIDGQVHAHRTDGRVHQTPLRLLFSVITPAVVTQVDPAEAAEVVTVSSVVSSTPGAFGCMPREELVVPGARSVVHDQGLRVAFVPLHGLKAYAVLSLIDFYKVKDAGLLTRYWFVRYGDKPVKVGVQPRLPRQALGIVTFEADKRRGLTHLRDDERGEGVDVARFLLRAGDSQEVVALDDNVARLLRSNLKLRDIQANNPA